jgi:phosphoribosylformylglycinamidine synthase II
MKTQTQARSDSRGASVHRELGLTDDEYQRIQDLLGRPPNRTELAMFAVMWSEHCSYKSSRAHLAGLPSDGPNVLMGPGEGAGVVRVGDVAVALRIESHNHPSFVEPFQGAATGVGGIIRDVLSVGARPIALADSLRFGPLPSEGRGAPEAAQRNRVLFEGVVSGVSSYGNCIGVPTVAGEVKFEDCYSGNPLVNVMCVGVAPLDRIRRARAEGAGNLVVLLGSKTGRDGIGGVSVLASASFGDGTNGKGDADKRPSVQVGDPFTEKLLIEACLELMDRELVVGIQDLGGAGLSCAASETAARAGTGMRIDLSRVPLREKAMEPFEVLTSESQERMLVVVRPEDLESVLEICNRWGLDSAVIGEVAGGGRLEVRRGQEVVADVPAAALGDGPSYRRPATKPPWLDALVDEDVAIPPKDLAESVLTLVSSPNVASKRWVWQQYDHQVLLGTVVRPGHDAAVLRIKGSGERIAMATDGNGRYCLLDPRLGAQHAVAEAARNVSVTGALPIGLTNCLNFGNPESPEVMWQFTESVRGMGEAASALAIPVTGGNVSFYNETAGESIYPTPVIGVVGTMPASVDPPAVGFQTSGDLVLLLGETKAELGGSEYVRTVIGKVAGRIPAIDLHREAALGRVIRELVGRRIISSAHDCSEGGLAVSLAECCIHSAGLGTVVRAESGLQTFEWLFSETSSRILISTDPAHLEDIKAICSAEAFPITELGVVEGNNLRIEGEETISIPVADLKRGYHEAIPRAMGYDPHDPSYAIPVGNPSGQKTRETIHDER